uniref:Uncharacterized protein n=1 Tax=viral metagenome TaxID=1070528 RepID=A0A6C0B7L8_9ZZZZ
MANNAGRQGFVRIIEDQIRYIPNIKTAIQNSLYNFDTTTTINNLPEHATVAGRIIGAQPNNIVFFMTVVMYNPAVGWWLLKRRRNDLNVHPQFWFDFGNNIANIFRTPNSYQIGPNVLADAYLNELNDTFDNAANIRAMCQNIGSKNMNEFANYNTTVHGGPWLANYRNTEYVFSNNDLVVDAQYGIPFFLIGKYNPDVNNNTKVTFYSNIVSKMFLMTRAERIEELTRDQRMRQIAIVAAILAANPIQQPRALPVINRPIVPEQNNDADAMAAAIAANRPILADQPIAVNQPIVPEQNNNADAMVAAIAANQPIAVNQPIVENQPIPRQNNDADAMVAAIAANRPINQPIVHEQNNDADAMVAAIAANPLQQLQNAQAPRQNNDAAMIAPIADQNNYAAMIVAILAHLRPDAYKYFMDNFHILLKDNIMDPAITKYQYQLLIIIPEVSKIFYILNKPRFLYDRIINTYFIINNDPDSQLKYGTNPANYIDQIIRTPQPTVNNIQTMLQGRIASFNNNVINAPSNFRYGQLKFDTRPNAQRSIEFSNNMNTIFGVVLEDNNNNDELLFEAELSNLKEFIFLCKFVDFINKLKNLKTLKIESRYTRQLSDIKKTCNERLNNVVSKIVYNQNSLYDRINAKIKLIIESTKLYNADKNPIITKDENGPRFLQLLDTLKQNIIDLFTKEKIFSSKIEKNTITSFIQLNNKIESFIKLDNKRMLYDEIDKNTKDTILHYISECYLKNLEYIIKMNTIFKRLRDYFTTFWGAIQTERNIVNNLNGRIRNYGDHIQYKQHIFNGLRATIIPQQNVIANQPQVANQNQRVARNGNVQQNRRGQPPANNINQQIAPANNARVRPNNPQQLRETAIAVATPIIRNINNKNVEQLVENTYKLGINNFRNPPELNNESDEFNITNPQHIAVLQETVRLIRQGY